MRKDMLQLIHEAHFGIEKCMKRAREIMYWPGMISDIETLVSQCVICEKFKKAHSKESLKPHAIPYTPFEMIGVDILDLGNTSYLDVIDYFAKWIEIAELVNKSADEVIVKRKTIFSRFGVPNIVVSDNIPFNSYTYKKFANDWDFDYAFINPHYCPSNGMVEKAVGISKSIIKRAREDRLDYLVGSMEYRNIPVAHTGIFEGGSQGSKVHYSCIMLLLISSTFGIDSKHSKNTDREHIKKLIVE
ncbi:uncharacterized protein K02A2.6 [Trichonephila clavipes]|nr:uncharacterized protein K02A2.6 [Trichonephila clavipes]